MKLIEDHFYDRKETFIDLLGLERQKKLHEMSTNLVKGNADVDLIQQLFLSDLIDIVEKEPNLRKMIGCTSRKQASQHLGGLNELRNKTMHLVKPLLEKVPEDMSKLHQRINRAEDIIEKLAG
jgi:hypothetical protein